MPFLELLGQAPIVTAAMSGEDTSGPAVVRSRWLIVLIMLEIALDLLKEAGGLRPILLPAKLLSRLLQSVVA